MLAEGTRVPVSGNRSEAWPAGELMSQGNLTETAPPRTQPRPTRRFRVSGREAALRVVVAFGVTVLVLPIALHLPTWIEYEIVLAAWWAVWLGLLTRLLFAGSRLTDDYELSPPRSWIPSSWIAAFNRKKKATTPSDGPEIDLGPLNGQAILVVLGVVVAGALIAMALWLVVEVAFPVLLFML
jgi:hypothetical protein